MSERQNYQAPSWVADAIFYQIFPERFCNGDPVNDPAGTQPWGGLPTRENFFGGDLQGVLQKLDYLQGLGVNAIYLNPIFAARTNHRYDTSDYFKVDPALGDLALLKALTEEMHRRGMHLILDGVFNHCGDGFAPFLDVRAKGERSEYRDWFVARSYPLSTDPLNFLTCGGCTYLPKLNHAYRPVQEFILKVARYWLEEAGIDGWRLDVPFKIPLPFWREFRQVVKSVNPQAYLVGEVWREAAPWVQGDVFDGVTNYRLRDILFDYVLTNVLDGEDFGYELQTLLTGHGPAARSMLNLLDSHDTARVLTTFKGDLERLRLALTAQMTLPGAPMIYYGDEVGLLGETDPDCRRCMPWEEHDWNLPVLQMTRELTALRQAHPALRQAHPALRSAQPQTLAAFNGIYAYRMAGAGDEVIVVLNAREAIPAFELPTLSTVQRWREFSRGQVIESPYGRLQFDWVPARSAQVFVPA
jgi:Glycosidases